MCMEYRVGTPLTPDWLIKTHLQQAYLIQHLEKTSLQVTFDLAIPKRKRRRRRRSKVSSFHLYPPSPHQGLQIVNTLIISTHLIAYIYTFSGSMETWPPKQSPSFPAVNNVHLTGLNSKCCIHLTTLPPQKRKYILYTRPPRAVLPDAIICSQS